MPAVKLSKASVTDLAPRPTTYIAYDKELSGFGCRVTPAGVKSWIVEYRPPGGGRRAAKRRLTLGSTTTLNSERARAAAKEVLARARLGDDVASQRAAQRKALTLTELVVRFMDEEIRPTRKASTAKLYDTYFNRHIRTALGSRIARDIAKSEILKLHRSIGAQSPVTANRVLVFLSGVFSWGAEIGEIPKGYDNSARGITRYEEHPKERFLSSDELARLGDALRVAETAGLPWTIDETRKTAKHAPAPERRRTVFSPEVTAAIRLLLFTGCRLREILHLTWDRIDFERGLIFLADSKTGPKPIVLSAPASSVLTGLERRSTFVIPGRDDGAPRHDLQRPWGAIIAYAKLPGLRIHDLRHSFAATGAGSGLGLLVIGKLLGHRNTETTQRYAHLALDPQKLAAERIAARLADAIGEPNPNVVPIQ